MMKKFVFGLLALCVLAVGGAVKADEVFLDGKGWEIYGFKNLTEENVIDPITELETGTWVFNVSHNGTPRDYDLVFTNDAWKNFEAIAHIAPPDGTNAFATGTTLTATTFFSISNESGADFRDVQLTVRIYSTASLDAIYFDDDISHNVLDGMGYTDMSKFGVYEYIIPLETLAGWFDAGGQHSITFFFDDVKGENNNDILLGIEFAATTDYNIVPEPATFAMIGLGLLGTGFAVRRRNRK